MQHAFFLAVFCIPLACLNSTLNALEDLHIFFPKEFSIVRHKKMPIKGKTEPNYHVSFYLDRVKVGETFAGHDGYFRYRLIDKFQLDDGIYTLNIVAVDNPYNVTHKTKKKIIFACSSDPLHDVYYLTIFLLNGNKP